jgi:hypothetical protein
MLLRASLLLTCAGCSFQIAGLTPGDGRAGAGDLPVDDLLTADLAGADLAGDLAIGDGVASPDLADGRVIATVSFSQSVSSTGMTPFSVIVAELTGDAHLDVATISPVRNEVDVLPGVGDGTLSAVTMVATGNTPRGLTAADMNNDGHLDLLTSNAGSNDVSVIVSMGNGQFAAQRAFPVGAVNYGRVVAGRFDGDNKLDVAVTNNGVGSISVLLGNGDGTLKPQHTFGTSLGPEGIAVGDWNGDSKLDLVTANNNIATGTDATLLIGDGGGNFAVGVSVKVDTAPYWPVALDANHDGKLDLAVASNSSPGQVAILLGDGKGGFQPAVSYQVGVGAREMAAADFNLDGNEDLATADYGAQTVSVLLGKADGTFDPAMTIAMPGASNPRGIAAGDLNGDGLPDLAVCLEATNQVVVLLNTSQ